MDASRLILLATLGLLAAPSARGETPRDRFRREYPAAATRLEAASRVLKVVVVRSRFDLGQDGRPVGEGAAVARRRETYYLDRDRRRQDVEVLVDAEGKHEAGRTTVRVEADGLGFSARRGAPTDRYELVARDPVAGAEPQPRHPPDFACYSTFNGEDVADFLAGPGVRIVDVTEEPGEGTGRLVKVSWEHRPPNGARLLGWFLFDPEQGWVLRETREFGIFPDGKESDAAIVRKVTYRGRLDDLPRPARVETWYEFQTGVKSLAKLDEFEEFSRAVSAKDFRTSALGLGFSQGTPTGSTPRYFLVVGLVGLVAAVAIRSLANRFRRPAPTARPS